MHSRHLERDNFKPEKYMNVLFILSLNYTKDSLMSQLFNFANNFS